MLTLQLEGASATFRLRLPFGTLGPFFWSLREMSGDVLEAQSLISSRMLAVDSVSLFDSIDFSRPGTLACRLPSSRQRATALRVNREYIERFDKHPVCFGPLRVGFGRESVAPKHWLGMILQGALEPRAMARRRFVQ